MLDPALRQVAQALAIINDYREQNIGLRYPVNPL